MILVLRPRCYSTWKHLAVFLVFVLFIWFQTRNVNEISTTSSSVIVVAAHNNNQSLNHTLNSDCTTIVPIPLKRFYHHVQNSTEFEETTSLPSISAADMLILRRKIARENALQTIYNQEVFGSIVSDTTIIVIQVNKRTQYLKQLISSLAQVRDIERALLVFSHDIYSDEINDVIQTIEFVRFIQIFYPYSIQTHPNVFPGPDPKDCPRNIGKKEAKLLKCQNAQYPDLYGHYREAKFTQTKHHWWWKANFVFNALNCTKNHTGLVLFLEEDHYVLSDFIYMVDLMIETGHKRCPNCNVFTLGNYIRTYAYMNEINKVEITPWISNKHNMGMGLTKKTWSEIVKCSRYFCHYDDYNWDWSLLYTSQVCLKEKLKALVVKSTRVFHIGECGVHHTKKNCDATTIIDKIKRLTFTVRKLLFPEHLVYVQSINMKKIKLRKGNGGWGDIRDHNLCTQAARLWSFSM